MQHKDIIIATKAERPLWLTRRDFVRSLLGISPLLLRPKLSLASSKPSKREVLEKFTSAMGGLASLQRVGTVSIKGNLTMTPPNDMSETKPNGTFEVLQDWNKYRYRETIVLDAGTVSVTSMNGFNSEESWTYGINGQLTVKKDADSISEEEISTRFDTFDYLIHPERYRFELAEKPDVFVLTITDLVHANSAYGQNIIEIDKKNYYPTKITTFGGDGSRQMVTNTSFQTFGDVLFPKRFIQTDSNRMVFDVLSIEQISEAHANFDPPPLPKDFEFLNGTEGRAPIRIVEGFILTTVSIHGSPYTFVVDTGAEESILDSSLANVLGLHATGDVSANGVSGEQQAGFITVQEMRVGTVTLRNQNIVTTDLSFLDTKLPHIDGILGRDFFHHFVVRLDYPGGIMEMFDPATFQYNGSGQRFPLVDHSFHASIEGIPVVLDIDTGSDTIDLFWSHFDRTLLMKNKQAMPMVAVRTGLGSLNSQMYFAMCHSISIGTYALRDVPIRFTESTQGAFATTGSAGNIGSPFWRRFITYFNFSEGQMILEPNANYAKPYASIGRAGLIISRPDKQWVVDAVVTRSPAAKVGLQKGDALLSIDGKLLSNMPIESVPPIFMQPAGTVLNIQYQRGSDKKMAQLILRDYIKYYDAY